MSNKFNSMLSGALDEVLEARAKHMRGEVAPLSMAVLVNVQKELEIMEKTMDPNVFKPSYPRFVLDWPDDAGLVSRLSEVAYFYEKLKGVHRG